MNTPDTKDTKYRKVTLFVVALILGSFLIALILGSLGRYLIKTYYSPKTSSPVATLFGIVEGPVEVTVSKDYKGLPGDIEVIAVNSGISNVAHSRDGRNYTYQKDGQTKCFYVNDPSQVTIVRSPGVNPGYVLVGVKMPGMPGYFIDIRATIWLKLEDKIGSFTEEQEQQFLKVIELERIKLKKGEM